MADARLIFTRTLGRLIERREPADDSQRTPQEAPRTTAQGPESYHKLGKRFFEHHGIDRDELLAELRKRFSERGK